MEEWARQDEGAALKMAGLVSAARRKRPLIEEAAGNFGDRAGDEAKARFAKFCEANAGWLPEYASFNVLRRRFGDVGWNQWPEDFAQRKHDALAALLTEQGRRLAVEQAVQSFFDEQWRTLRAYCAERGDTDSGRCGDLCELRQRGGVEAPGVVRVGREGRDGACVGRGRRTTIRLRASGGAIRCTGGRC